MPSARQTHDAMRPAYERGLVDCEKCGTPIVVNRPAVVSLEFCVPCNKCGHRGIYFKRMIYIEEAVKRRPKPR